MGNEYMNKEVILSVKDLRINFRAYGGLVQAVRGIDFDLHRGETLAIVGESGSGKSVSIKAEAGMKERFVRIFSDSVISITASANLIILKTLSGSANAAAEAVDSMHWDEIAGTMAGDNTIFIAAKSEKVVPEIVEKLGMMIRK